MNPCDICLDEKCEGKRSCNCETCKVKEDCPKYLRPTIRITTKCTQSCKHCCFSCSPKKNDMMTIETSELIGRFLKSNKIRSANLMGGEFFCNPDWFEICSNIVKNLGEYARIVTNSDWASDKKISDKVIEFGKSFNVYYALTVDNWHTNKYVEKAKKLLSDNNIDYILGDHESDDCESVMDNAIVPVGQAIFTYGLYSTFAAYCYNQDRKYSFLIDEEGKIFKCPFGLWQYAYVGNYVDGGFNSRFKKFNLVFYKCFISNCRSCLCSHNAIWKDKKS